MIKKYDLFNESKQWGEGESIYVKGIGFLTMCVEDNVGSVTVYITDKKYAESHDIPSDAIISQAKLCYHGSFAPDGSGAFYFDLQGNTYQSGIAFKTFDAGEFLFEKWLDSHNRDVMRRVARQMVFNFMM